MPTPLADLKILVGVDQTGLPGALAAIESKVSQSGKRQAAALSGGGGIGGANKFNFAIQQASFGVQDFFQQLGPMGLAGALSASANNWSQVAAIINPLHGAFAGIAITMASVLIPQMFKTKDAAKDTKEGIDALTESFRKQQSVLESMSKIRQADKGVAGIKDPKAAAKEIEEVDEKIKESVKHQADLAKDVKDAAAMGRTQVVGNLGIGDIRAQGFEFNKMAELGEDAHGNKDAGLLKERTNAILKAMGHDATTHTAEIDGDRLVISRLRTVEQIKEIEKRITDLREQQGKEGVEQDILHARRTALETRIKDLKQEAVDDLTKKTRDNLAEGENNPFQKKAEELKQKRRETIDEIMKTLPAGADRAAMIRDVNQSFQKQIRNVGKDERAALSRDMQRDIMGDRASKIDDIAHTLEERGKKIDQLFPEGKERGMALSAAAAAAQAQRKALDTPSTGDKVGMGGLHDLIQKQLSDKDYTQDTAKNTADANTKLDSLITAFNTRSMVAVAAP